MKISIKLSNSEEIEQVIKKNSIVIGRSTKCDFSVPDEVLSRQHCLIEYINEDLTITDLGSSNGVFVGDQRIPPNKKIPIMTFMPLNLGGLECVITLSEEYMGESSASKSETAPKASTNQTGITKQHKK